MRRSLISFAFVIMAFGAEPAVAERLVVSLSNHRVAVTSNFVGEDLVLFGTIEPEPAGSPLRPPYDLVVTVSGPASNTPDPAQAAHGSASGSMPTRANSSARRSYLAVLSNRPVNDNRQRRIRCDGCRSGSIISCCRSALAPISLIRSATSRSGAPSCGCKTQQGLYRESGTAVTFLTPTVFRAAIPMPAAVPTGTYDIDVGLFAGGALVARTNSALEVIKTGFEQYVADAARDHGLLYGMATALMALVIGWFASVVFARD